MSVSPVPVLDELVDTTQGETIPAPEGGRRASAVRGGIWSALSQLVPALGTAVLSVAAGRYLGSERLGQQSLIAYANAAVAFVLVAALNTAVLQAGGRLQGLGDARSLQLLSRWAIRAHVASGVVVLAVMVVSGLFVGNNLAAWIIIGVVSILDAAADGLAIRLILAEGWAPIGKLRLVFQFLGPPLGLVFLFAGFGVAGIFIGDGLAALGLLVAVAGRYRRLHRAAATATGVPSAAVAATSDGPPVERRPMPFARTPADAPRTLGEDGPAEDRPAEDRTPPVRGHGVRPPVPVFRTFALFGIGALITQVVSKRVEFIVLAAFAGDTAIGMYSVAFMAVNLISMVPVGIAVAAMPLVAAAESRGETGLANRHLRLAVRLGTAVGIPLTALLAALGPSAVILVYGTAYDTAARLVPLASASLLVAVIGGVCSQFWSGQNRLRIVLGTGGLAAVVDLAVALVLVPHFAATGAAVANLSGQLALAVGLLVATVRETGPIGWRLWSFVSFGLAATAGAVTALWVRVAVDRLLPVGVESRALVALVLGSLAGVVVIMGVALMIKLFDDEEAEWLRPLVPAPLHGLLERLTDAALQEVPVADRTGS